MISPWRTHTLIINAELAFSQVFGDPLGSRTVGVGESASGWVLCLRIMSANNIDMPAKERHSSTGASFQRRLESIYG